MKIILVVLIALSAQISSANCLGEAQIIASVESVTQKTDNVLLVKIAAQSIVQYNESMVCPLDLYEVLENGFEVKSENGIVIEAGQAISGVLVKNISGGIYLE